MTIRPLETLFALSFAALLAFAPACDKKADDKKTDDKKADDKKADDKKADVEAKTEAKTDPAEGHDAAPKTEVAELTGDGRVEINVDAGGYHPAEIHAPAKSKLTLAFTRTTEAGCGQKLVLASMEIEKDLPLNEVVEIEVEVPESGELGFACGMDMYKGKVVPKA